FTTDPAVRCLVEYWPQGAPSRMIPVRQEEKEARLHELTIGLITPGEPCVVRVTALLADGASSTAAEWAITGLTARLDALSRELAGLDEPRLVQDAQRRLKAGARMEEVGRGLAHALETRTRGLAGLKQLLPDVLGPESTP